MKKMKRTASAIILLLMLFLSACTATAGGTSEKDPFEMLKGPLTLSGTLAVGEREYGMRLTTPDGKTAKVEFLSPESMQGYVFEKAEDGFFISYGDLRVPLKSGVLPGGAGVLLSLWEMDPAAIQKSETKANGMDLTVYTLPLGADGEMRIFLKKADNTPLRVEFDSRLGSGIFHISEVKYE